MADFQVIKAADAPVQPKKGRPLQARMLEYERYVSGIKRGQAGKLVPGPGESLRGLALRISRAGKRLGKPVQTWVVEGTLYFSVG